MKQCFDRNGKEIKAGMFLLYEWADGSGCCVKVCEHDGELCSDGSIVGDDYFPIYKTDLPHATIQEFKQRKK